MRLWKINCMEDSFPGMWQRWFRNQCVAIGWHGEWGFPLRGQITARDYAQAWSRARSSLQRIEVGHHIIVSLKGNRVGRLTARGILVHGGSKKLHDDVVKAAANKPKIEVVQHRLAVDFSRCN